MRFIVKFCAVMLAALTLSFTAFAAEPTADEIEARAKDVGHALRCVVCQNQSIEESDASLAQDMRLLVRARIKAGDSNEDVIAFMRDRYGDYVLLKPPMQGNTYVLWFTPFLLVLLCGAWFLISTRKRSSAVIEPLSEAEAAALKRLTDGADINAGDTGS